MATPMTCPREMILCHAASDVCVMMLHRNLSLDRGGERHACAPVAGMQIVGNAFGGSLEEVLRLFERFFEELHGLVVFEVADMLAQDGVSVTGQAESVFQLCPDGENLFQLDAQIDGLRHEAAGTTQHALAPLEDADHRIVHSRGDVAVMQQKPVRDARRCSIASVFETTIGSSLRLPLVITSAANSDGDSGESLKSR